MFVPFAFNVTLSRPLNVKAYLPIDVALERYVEFLKKTGGVSLGELIEGAGFESPFNEGSLLKTAQTTVKIIAEAEKKI